MPYKTINCVFKVKDIELVEVENEMRQVLEIVDFRVIPNTDELYEKDEHFRKILNKLKSIKKERDSYINKHNKQ